MSAPPHINDDHPTPLLSTAPSLTSPLSSVAAKPFYPLSYQSDGHRKPSITAQPFYPPSLSQQTSHSSSIHNNDSGGDLIFPTNPTTNKSTNNTNAGSTLGKKKDAAITTITTKSSTAAINKEDDTKNQNRKKNTTPITKDGKKPKNTTLNDSSQDSLKSITLSAGSVSYSVTQPPSPLVFPTPSASPIPKDAKPRNVAQNAQNLPTSTNPTTSQFQTMKAIPFHPSKPPTKTPMTPSSSIVSTTTLSYPNINMSGINHDFDPYTHPYSSHYTALYPPTTPYSGEVFFPPTVLPPPSTDTEKKLAPFHSKPDTTNNTSSSSIETAPLLMGANHTFYNTEFPPKHTPGETFYVQHVPRGTVLVTQYGLMDEDQYSDYEDDYDEDYEQDPYYDDYHHAMSYGMQFAPPMLPPSLDFPQQLPHPNLVNNDTTGYGVLPPTLTYSHRSNSTIFYPPAPDTTPTTLTPPNLAGIGLRIPPGQSRLTVAAHAKLQLQLTTPILAENFAPPSGPLLLPQVSVTSQNKTGDATNLPLSSKYDIYLLDHHAAVASTVTLTPTAPLSKKAQKKEEAAVVNANGKGKQSVSHNTATTLQHHNNPSSSQTTPKSTVAIDIKKLFSDYQKNYQQQQFYVQYYLAYMIHHYITEVYKAMQQSTLCMGNVNGNNNSYPHFLNNKEKYQHANKSAKNDENEPDESDANISTHTTAFKNGKYTKYSNNNNCNATDTRIQTNNWALLPVSLLTPDRLQFSLHFRYPLPPKINYPRQFATKVSQTNRKHKQQLQQLQHVLQHFNTSNISPDVDGDTNSLTFASNDAEVGAVLEILSHPTDSITTTKIVTDTSPITRPTSTNVPTDGSNTDNSTKDVFTTTSSSATLPSAQGVVTLSSQSSPNQQFTISLDGRYILLPPAQHTIHHHNGFTVLHYNILADYLAHPKMYWYTPQFALQWEYRWELIKKEIFHYKPHIICLQEVQIQHYEGILNCLSKHGYCGEFLPKTRSPMGGLLTSVNHNNSNNTTPSKTANGSTNSLNSPTNMPSPSVLSAQQVFYNDGVATFWDSRMFVKRTHHELKFDHIAQQLAQQYDEAQNVENTEQNTPTLPSKHDKKKKEKEKKMQEIYRPPAAQSPLPQGGSESDFNIKDKNAVALADKVSPYLLPRTACGHVIRGHVALLVELEFRPQTHATSKNTSKDFNNNGNMNPNTIKNSYKDDYSNTNNNNKSVCVVNTHIYWNPQESDVKLWQTMTLCHYIQQHYPTTSTTPVIICGDFNSTPDSYVYSFLLHQKVPSHFNNQEDNRLNVLPTSRQHITHKLKLQSTYHNIVNTEPVYTNLTDKFQGTLDYILYTPSSSSLQCTHILTGYPDYHQQALLLQSQYAGAGPEIFERTPILPQITLPYYHFLNLDQNSDLHRTPNIDDSSAGNGMIVQPPYWLPVYPSKSSVIPNNNELGPFPPMLMENPTELKNSQFYSGLMPSIYAPSDHIPLVACFKF